MKMKRNAFGLILALALVASTPALAQLTLESSTVDGGGGTSSGGSFEVSGTAGQFDAGSATDGTFEVQSGFWTSENPAVPVELQSFQIVLNRIREARQSRLASAIGEPICRREAGLLVDGIRPEDSGQGPNDETLKAQGNHRIGT